MSVLSYNNPIYLKGKGTQLYISKTPDYVPDEISKLVFLTEDPLKLIFVPKGRRPKTKVLNGDIIYISSADKNLILQKSNIDSSVIWIVRSSRYSEDSGFKIICQNKKEGDELSIKDTLIFLSDGYAMKVNRDSKSLEISNKSLKNSLLDEEILFETEKERNEKFLYNNASGKDASDHENVDCYAGVCIFFISLSSMILLLCILINLYKSCFNS